MVVDTLLRGVCVVDMQHSWRWARLGGEQKPESRKAEAGAGDAVLACDCEWQLSRGRVMVVECGFVNLVGWMK